MDTEEILARLRSECEKAGSQAAWAKAHGFSQVYVWQVLAGKKQVSTRLASALGVERVVVYRHRCAGNEPEEPG